MTTDSSIQPSPPRLSDEVPFLETGPGGLFFANLLVATPVLVILVPVVIKAIASTLGLVQGSAPMLDTIPLVASYAIPLDRLDLRFRVPSDHQEPPPRSSPVARRMLYGFALLHAGVLVATVFAWVSWV